MILYQEVATDSLAEAHGQLQSALIASQPHQRRWHTRWLPYDLHPLRALALLHDASSISCPLDSFLSDETIPVAWTEASLASTYRHVQQVQLVLEPVACFVSTSTQGGHTHSEMNEAEFLSRLLTRTGCGWLANLTQLVANSAGQRFDPYEFLAEVLPCAARVQIELSTEESVPAAVWDLYRFARQQARGKLEAVFAPTDADTTAHLLRIEDELQRQVCLRRELLPKQARF